MKSLSLAIVLGVFAGLTVELLSREILGQGALTLGGDLVACAVASAITTKWLK